MFNGANILITGGTGSLGQCLISNIARRYNPRRLIVFSRDELKQFEMSQKFKGENLRFFLGDIRDRERLVRAFQGVDYVIHTAALKQVPALEYNPGEAIRTNIYGSENVIHAAIECGVKQLVALSTDKAANAVNLYGATKLAADKLFIAANYSKGRAPTTFSVVRYGNVLGSRGSILPFFRSLIQQGATELPITDPRMTRFIITLQQAVDLVLKSFERMHGGELFIPKIPSVGIADFAKALAPKLPLKVIGIRPGEKLHESLCPAELSHAALAFDDFYLVKPDPVYFEGVDFAETRIGEKGTPVEYGFEYRSDNNPDFLTIQEISSLIESAGL